VGERPHDRLGHGVRREPVVEGAGLGGRLAGADPGHELGLDGAGRDQGHLDAAPGDLAAQPLGEALHRELRRAVRGLARRRHVARDRADVDDVPTAPFEHPGQHALGQVDEGEHVDLEQLADLLGRHRLDDALPAEPGVVHQHVDRLAFLDQ
jgi:hypothetical protein